MKPEQSLRQLNAFVDSELELGQQIQMEAQIAADPGLAAQAASLRALRDAIRQGADYHAAPAALKAGLQGFARVPPAAKPAAKPVEHFAGIRRWLTWRPPMWAFALTSLLVAGGSFVASSPSRDDRLARDVIASHVRSTLGSHLLDVASSDRHTVKPWLSSKLDFSPPVADLQVSGATFDGGRVDYVDGHAVAVLVYKRREHVVNTFVWPTREADATPRVLAQRGFNIVHWTRASMTYWMVSDLNKDELLGLASALDHAGIER
ncbi:anti-sigma factor family protein [Methylibium sp.]|uniref:anti-sigma factor family protein n=1 Tax=Methylibium sp. TaxID=2067992 RepID=UPI003D0EA3E2